MEQYSALNYIGPGAKHLAIGRGKAQTTTVSVNTRAELQLQIREVRGLLGFELCARQHGLGAADSSTFGVLIRLSLHGVSIYAYSDKKLPKRAPPLHIALYV